MVGPWSGAEWAQKLQVCSGPSQTAQWLFPFLCMHDVVMQMASSFSRPRCTRFSVGSPSPLQLSSSRGLDEKTSSNDFFTSSVVVRQSFYGCEVVISTRLGPQALTLSRVTELLLEEGFYVVCCVSTRIKGRLVHTIQSEVNDLTCIDVPGLERKLNEEVSSFNQISCFHVTQPTGDKQMAKDNNIVPLQGIRPTESVAPCP